MKKRTLRFALGRIALAGILLVSPALAADVTETARWLVGSFNASEYDAIQQKFSPEMSATLPPEQATAFFTQLRTQLGTMTAVEPIRVHSDRGKFKLDFERGVFDLFLILDPKDQITGLLIQAPEPEPPAAQPNQTSLALPFSGRWEVFWGGSTAEQNAHHDVPNQRFALDLVGVNEAGEKHRGDGTRNEEYYAFGREVLAPADGTVLEVIRGVRDNVPGSMNPFLAMGNAVLLQHAENEVSVFAHFKQGSLRVEVGDPVKQGQVLGLCGNSGNSSEPHLHYHLQDSPVLQDGRGLEVEFEGLTLLREGQTASPVRSALIRGDIVSPASAER